MEDNSDEFFCSNMNIDVNLPESWNIIFKENVSYDQNLYSKRGREKKKGNETEIDEYMQIHKN